VIARNRRRPPRLSFCEERPHSGPLVDGAISRAALLHRTAEPAVEISVDLHYFAAPPGHSHPGRRGVRRAAVLLRRRSRWFCGSPCSRRFATWLAAAFHRIRGCGAPLRCASRAGAAHQDCVASRMSAVSPPPDAIPLARRRAASHRRGDISRAVSPRGAVLEPRVADGWRNSLMRLSPTAHAAPSPKPKMPASTNTFAPLHLEIVPTRAWPGSDQSVVRQCDGR